jgi:hypothetical protein
MGDYSLKGIIMKKKPEFYSEEHASYLSTLRDSGLMNMYGAPHVLMDAYDLTKSEAEAVFFYWVSSSEG